MHRPVLPEPVMPTTTPCVVRSRASYMTYLSGRTVLLVEVVLAAQVEAGGLLDVEGGGGGRVRRPRGILSWVDGYRRAAGVSRLM